MKRYKWIILLGIFILNTSVIPLAQVVDEHESNSSISFIDESSPDFPREVHAPGLTEGSLSSTKDITTRPGDGIVTGQYGTISLDFIPNFYFDGDGLDLSEKTTQTTVAEPIHYGENPIENAQYPKECPSFVQVSSYQDRKNVWELQVGLTKAFTASNEKVLEGAQIILKNSYRSKMKNDQVMPNKLNNEITINNEGNISLVGVTNDMSETCGKGTFQIAFGSTDGSTVENGVSLVIPPSVKYKTTYEAQICWTLTNAPANP